MLDRLIAAVWRIMDAVLPHPPDDEERPQGDPTGALARFRLRWRLTEKQGHGGNR